MAYIPRSGWIKVETVPDEHEEARDYEPSFWYGNRRHFLSDFIRVQGNPWASFSDVPEYIHAYEAENYFDPLYLELDPSGEMVRVYGESK